MTTHPHRVFRRVAPLVALTGLLALSVPLRSLTLPQDQGASGTWQKHQKLQPTASVLHTTAHADDELGGMLTMLSRRDRARVPAEVEERVKGCIDLGLLEQWLARAVVVTRAEEIFG